MKKALLSSLLLLTLAACQQPQSDVVITLIGTSDYHSHAVPFYSEGKHGQAGIARAIAYFKKARETPGTLIASGGDTINIGTPTWSDEYRCVEWPWLNGLLDVMAVGNHEFDYGPEEFQRCAASVDYPIISSNLVGADGQPLLQPGGKPYVIREVQGLRVGFFALGGPDFPRLIRANLMPPGSSWTDPTPMARATVQQLREVEKVEAVVFIGHQYREDDEAMARAVPGIDLILGSHSHLKSELVKIEGTQTHFISAYQYLTYVSRVELRFREGKLVGVTGNLVKMDETLPEDTEIKARVQELQAQLVARRPERFQVLGQAQVELSDANVNRNESVLGNWATEVLRRAARAHVFFSTASSFRASIPPGDITVEAFYTAIPYRNIVYTADVTGEQLLAWLSLSVSRSGSDMFSQQSGVRYRVVEGRPAQVQVLVDPARPEAGFAPLVPSATYRLSTTNYQALVASGYKDLFTGYTNAVNTGLDAHAVLIEALRAGPITAALDGRSGGN